MPFREYFIPLSSNLHHQSQVRNTSLIQRPKLGYSFSIRFQDCNPISITNRITRLVRFNAVTKILIAGTGSKYPKYYNSKKGPSSKLYGKLSPEIDAYSFS
ncbi:hypothetical protein LXL04_016957 [Taraxacum kok-saghyz]